MRTLFVRRTNRAELNREWEGLVIPRGAFPHSIYVRCSALGRIDWDTAKIYGEKELIERHNVKIIR